MRKLFVLMLSLLVFNMAQAQGVFSWGLKAGGNTVAKIKISDFENIPTTGEEVENIIVSQGDKPWGMHFGAFARIKILAVYVQPELIFSQTKTEIDIHSVNSTGSAIQMVGDQKFNKFDIPIMIGAKFGPARVNLGPVATFVLSEGGSFRDKVNEVATEITNSVEEYKVTEEFTGATFGFQVGAGLDILQKVSVDIRYEFGLSKYGDSVKIGNKSFKTDQRNSQLVLSLGVYL